MVREYIGVALRWLWLILIAGVVAAAVTYAIAESQPRLYEASARLVIGPGIEAINPDLNDMRAAAQLMWTYAEYATTPTVLQKVIDEARLPMDVKTLRSKISVVSDQTSLWLTIRVRSNDYNEPPVIANALANALVAMSPSNADTTNDHIKGNIGRQVYKLEQDLEAIEAQIADDQAKFAATDVQDLQDFYQGRIEQQRAYEADLRNSLIDLYAMYQETYTNQVTLVESPVYAETVDLNVSVLVMLAGLAGMLAASAIVFAFHYFGPAAKPVKATRPRSTTPRTDQKARPVPVPEGADGSRPKPTTATSPNV